ncbi:hypothetical protein J41TS12_45270 [Paenibacillus antibioticophila]|uniref:Uncharacterized protein n=1 Tax=Paenibacillus antibioticophila TaxID=1274374 RepID=A0A919XUR6_9BACL|nr:hypothetical protein J41TS12_45270 [Paenibacillus antibioticophila]
MCSDEFFDTCPMITAGTRLILLDESFGQAAPKAIRIIGGTPAHSNRRLSGILSDIYLPFFLADKDIHFT